MGVPGCPELAACTASIDKRADGVDTRQIHRLRQRVGWRGGGRTHCGSLHSPVIRGMAHAPVRRYVSLSMAGFIGVSMLPFSLYPGRWTIPVGNSIMVPAFKP